MQFTQEPILLSICPWKDPPLLVSARKAVQVKLLSLTPLDQDPEFLVRDQGQAPVRKVRVLPLREPPVVLENHVAEDDLELVGGEEAPRTPVQTVPEADVLSAGADEVCHVLLLGAAEAGKPVWVEFRRVLPDGL